MFCADTRDTSRVWLVLKLEHAHSLWISRISGLCVTLAALMTDPSQYRSSCQQRYQVSWRFMQCRALYPTVMQPSFCEIQWYGNTSIRPFYHLESRVRKQMIGYGAQMIGLYAGVYIYMCVYLSQPCEVYIFQEELNGEVEKFFE